MALAFVAPAARAVTLPAGFDDVTLPWNFDVPTKICFFPDGRMLVCEKGGIVYLVDATGTQRTPIWVGEDEVLNTDDRGLLSVAIDPRYATNRFIYLLYVCDPDSNGVELDNYDDAYGRLTRYRMADNDSILDPASRTVLIGAGWPDAFISASGTHAVGDLEWGLDGSLFVTCGDGAHFEYVDAGGNDPGQFIAGRSNAGLDIGAFRAQSLESLNGKVLRVNPASGCGLPDNPFWDGDSTSTRSRIWLTGLRNPFRITRVPDTGSGNPADHDPGELVIADVGWLDWEEIDRAPRGGLNFGWPCYEGGLPQSGYPFAEPRAYDCATIGAPADPTLLTAPWITASHANPDLSSPPGFYGGSIIGGVHYTGSAYPLVYRGRYFFGDYVQNCIRFSTSGTPGSPPVVATFSENADGPVSFARDPRNGDLWYVAIYTGQIHRIAYQAAAVAVDARATAGLALSAPRPNPARGATSFTLSLAEGGVVAWEVLDVNGRRVWQGGAAWRPPGEHTLRWPGTSGTGAPVHPGIYLVRVRANGATLTGRCAVVR